MSRKRCTLIILSLLCFAFVLAGCPKKTVTMDEAAMKGSDAAAAERERQARLEAERAKQEQELMAREEAARKAQAEIWSFCF